MIFAEAVRDSDEAFRDFAEPSDHFSEAPGVSRKPSDIPRKLQTQRNDASISAQWKGQAASPSLRPPSAISSAPRAAGAEQVRRARRATNGAFAHTDRWVSRSPHGSLQLLALALCVSAGCRPSGICEAPRRGDATAGCPSGCGRIDLLREDGACHRRDSYLCVDEGVVLGAGGACFVDPDGVRFGARYTGYAEELEAIGWRACSEAEATGFPIVECAD